MQRDYTSSEMDISERITLSRHFISSNRCLQDPVHLKVLLQKGDP